MLKWKRGPDGKWYAVGSKTLPTAPAKPKRPKKPAKAAEGGGDGDGAGTAESSDT